MMKKLVLVLALTLVGIFSAKAIDLSYKGYGELYTGYSAPSNSSVYGGGANFGISTSHGVNLFPSLFVGGGIDFNVSMYEDKYYSRYSETDYSALFAVFAESRYNFLPSRKASPFVGLRIGGGYNGYDEEGCFYFSPAVGCSINLTDKFGLDASVGYSLFTGVGPEPGYNDHYGNINCISFRVGVHF